MQLGIHERFIMDYQFTASSYTTDHSPSEVRPTSRGWCADTNDTYPYIQVCETELHFSDVAFQLVNEILVIAIYFYWTWLRYARIQNV